MKAIKSAIFIISLFLGQCLFAQSSPIPMLEDSAKHIIMALKQNKANLKSKPQLIYQTVEQYLLPNVDVEGMSRSVLGRQAWSKASANERAEFSRAFTQLVIRTYANPLTEYTDEKINFLPIRGSLEKRFLRVNSTIVRTNGKNIPLSYGLVVKNGNWKIYDLSVEGVSLLQSFRSQFAQALQNSSMQDLIEQMRQRSNKGA